MADAILLSDATYKRLMKMLEKWEKGEIVALAEGLKIIETGTGYQKIGPTETLDLVVCINGTPVTKKFMLAD